MHIRDIEPSEYEAARTLLAENGWEKRIADAEVFAQLVQHSQELRNKISRSCADVPWRERKWVWLSSCSE
jgi:hypothetical protein